MTKKIVWLILSFLIALILVVVSCGTAAVVEEGEDEVTPVPPKPGEWAASTEFGELGFTVNPDGRGIAKVSFDFAEFKCGGIERSGGMSIAHETPWPITDGQFTVDTTIGPTVTWDIVIQGEFDKAGTHASGTWKISSAGTSCSGTWESSPAP